MGKEIRHQLRNKIKLRKKLNKQTENGQTKESQLQLFLETPYLCESILKDQKPIRFLISNKSKST